jgi:hypothetical protein
MELGGDAGQLVGQATHQARDLLGHGPEAEPGQRGAPVDVVHDDEVAAEGPGRGGGEPHRRRREAGVRHVALDRRLPGARRGVRHDLRHQVAVEVGRRAAEAEAEHLRPEAARQDRGRLAVVEVGDTGRQPQGVEQRRCRRRHRGR